MTDPEQIAEDLAVAVDDRIESLAAEDALDALIKLRHKLEDRIAGLRDDVR